MSLTAGKADWKLVKKYAKRLNADIAFEEVDGVAMAKKAYGASSTTFHSTTEPDVQKPGFAVRKGITFTRNPDFGRSRRHRGSAAIAAPRRRHHGATRGTESRMLAVHLKSGCPAQSLDNTSGDACPAAQGSSCQFSRAGSRSVSIGCAVHHPGDFNRIFEDNEAFWRGNEPQRRGRPDPLHCRPHIRLLAGKHPKFIDHIVFGGPARQWAQSSSFKVMVYDETDPKFQTGSAIIARNT